MPLRALLLLALVTCSALPGAVLADGSVQVIETWPAGDEVVLARNQNYYLRLAYSSDAPVRIWARPFLHGREANAGSHPSALYSGSGEMLGWFFLMQPGDEVDEIRISMGGGGTGNTPVVASHRVRVTGGSHAANAQREPAWVATLRAQAEEAERQAMEDRMNEPESIGDTVLFGGFMLAMVALGVAGVAAPVVAVRRWQGGWRIAAMLPLVLVAFVVLRLVVDVVIDPTSHNLWPFEILQVGFLNIVVMGVLWIARKVCGVRGND